VAFNKKVAYEILGHNLCSWSEQKTLLRIGSNNSPASMSAVHDAVPLSAMCDRATGNRSVYKHCTTNLTRSNCQLQGVSWNISKHTRSHRDQPTANL